MLPLEERPGVEIRSIEDVPKFRDELFSHYNAISEESTRFTRRYSKKGSRDAQLSEILVWVMTAEKARQSRPESVLSGTKVQVTLNASSTYARMHRNANTLASNLPTYRKDLKRLLTSIDDCVNERSLDGVSVQTLTDLPKYFEPLPTIASALRQYKSDIDSMFGLEETSPDDPNIRLDDIISLLKSELEQDEARPSEIVKTVGVLEQNARNCAKRFEAAADYLEESGGQMSELLSARYGRPSK